ncbi:MAG: Ig-like domain-containing protein [Lachnospiraceae bacterium]|nr:Ig-like domain-containing protein [Lachnospiraceae bacterium]
MADTPVSIYTAQDLAAMKNNPSGSYSLEADIDMTGVDWIPFSFSGRLEGNGHAIVNLTISRLGEDTAETVDGNNKVYDTRFSGLFSTLKGAEVADLQLLGLNVSIVTDEHCFIGGIAGFMEDSVIAGCSVTDARLDLTTGGVMVGIGGLVGFGYGTIIGCEADVLPVFHDSDPETLCEEFIGGALACGNAWIYDCSISLRSYAACTGYVHNGGLVGMFYCYREDMLRGEIRGCSVRGFMRFYENNEDRRAYCAPYIGEELSWVDVMECEEDFTNDETWNYEDRMEPEKCASPDMETALVTALCTGWSYVLHTCSVCDYSYKDTFTPASHQDTTWEILIPSTTDTEGFRQQVCLSCDFVLGEEVIPPHVHEPGEWTTTKEPAYQVEGLKQVLCTGCGEALEEETIPALTTPPTLVMSPETVRVNYKDTASLSVICTDCPSDPETLHWTSDNEAVAKVDSQGTVLALSKGTCTITCTNDMGLTDSCQVTVGYSFGQWLIVILLFGWIWY